MSCCKRELTPVADARKLVGEWGSLRWCSKNSLPYSRNSVRAMWKELVETYGRNEAESLVYLVLGEDDTALWGLTSMGDSEREGDEDGEKG